MVSAIAWLAAFLTCSSVQAQDNPAAASLADVAPSARLPTICLILPLSGPHEALGRRVERVIRGVLEGESITIRTFDSHDPAGPASQVGRAQDAGCDLAIGGLGDVESRTLSDAAEAATLPFLTLGRVVNERSRDHVIQVRTPRADAVAAAAHHAIEAAGRTVAHVLVPDTPYGREVAKAFRPGFEAGGGRVQSERAVPVGEDLAKTAATFQATRAASPPLGDGPAPDAARSLACEREVLFLGFDLTTARRLLSLLEFEGVPVRGGEQCPPILILGTSLWNDRARVSRMGDELDGARFLDVALGEGERDVLDAEVRDAAFLALALLKKRGSVRDRREGGAESDFIAVARWAEGIEFRGATGDLEVRGGQVVGRTLTVFEIRRGEIRPVTEEPEP